MQLLFITVLTAKELYQALSYDIFNICDTVGHDSTPKFKEFAVDIPIYT
jgi:hypothetical protein